MKGIETRWHWIPGGKFKMGSPLTEPRREADENQVDVTLTQGFWMLETAVTQELWTAVMGTTIDQQKFKAGESSLYGVGAKHPMYYVNYEEAVEFSSKLNVLLKAIPTASDLVARLPTDAEWEYATPGLGPRPSTIGATATKKRISTPGTWKIPAAAHNQ